MQETDGLSADGMIRAVKILFSALGLPRKIVLYAGTNFISDKFRQYANSGQVEGCIKFIKCTIKKNLDNNEHIYFTDQSEPCYHK